MGCEMMMEDESPIEMSIKKLKALSKKMGGKEAEALSEVIDALKEATGVSEGNDYEDEMESDESSKAGKSIIIASLKKKFGAEEEE